MLVYELVMKSSQLGLLPQIGKKEHLESESDKWNFQGKLNLVNDSVLAAWAEVMASDLV